MRTFLWKLIPFVAQLPRLDLLFPRPLRNHLSRLVSLASSPHMHAFCSVFSLFNSRQGINWALINCVYLAILKLVHLILLFLNGSTKATAIGFLCKTLPSVEIWKILRRLIFILILLSTNPSLPNQTGYKSTNIVYKSWKVMLDSVKN